MLKKLTAAGILAAAASGAMLLGGPADADLLSAHKAPTNPVNGCYYGQPVYYQPAWCTNAPSIAVYPDYPGYSAYPGWNRWHHHHNWPGRVYFRR